MTTRPGTLLLVDDEEMNRDMLGRRLELHGYQVTPADGGPTALRLVEEQHFEVVLLDIMMPEMNGLEVLRRIRLRHGLGELPVIMVTAKNQSSDVVEALQVGANDYVTKPVDFPVLLARIATQLTHQRAQAALRESESRYALAARGTNDGLWDWDLRTDQVYYSPRWKAMLGYQEDEIASTPEEWLSRVHPADLARLYADLSAHRGGLSPQFENEHRLLHKDRTYRWMLSRGMSIRDGASKELRIVGSLTDITGGKVCDPLTGLPNRILFMDRLERAVERCKRHPEGLFALLFLDLDRFKVINDSLGHVVGDQLLTAIARRLESCLRATDSLARLGERYTFARLGGDEFTILLEDLKSGDDAAGVAERIQKALALPFELEEHAVYVTASIGITLSTAFYDSAEETLRDADTAMYSAKVAGKARYALFDGEMRTRAIARMQTEIDLRRALENQHFRLHYQPIISLETRRLVGFEALVRWQHPERGLISPADFLAVAEETGLIVPLGWWVLGEACRQLSRWQAAFPCDPPLLMCVNVSSKQFLQADVVRGIETLLNETGLDPRSLKLEIAERTILDHPHTATTILEQVQTLGVRVSVDDFGAGYATLSYIHRLPINSVKIDRGFVDRLDESENLEIVEAMVRLAHNLDLEVVAEGVETESQRDWLRALDCELAQGYLFSEPLDAHAAGVLLSLDQIPAASLRAPDEPAPAMG